MPRPSRYLVEGYTYHLTHRCHNRDFHLRSSKDKNAYRRWLHEAVCRYKVPVYHYMITNNHVHLIVHADSIENVSRLMHLASGSMAAAYNERKEHQGAVWEHPYHCTLVQDGQHLLNCLRYITLNMNRAGIVEHPDQWPWCGHDELTGTRKRYRLLNVERLVESLGFDDVDHFRECYEFTLDEALRSDQLRREAHWTEALAVGSASFIGSVGDIFDDRRTFRSSSIEGTGAWVVKEESPRYKA